MAISPYNAGTNAGIADTHLQFPHQFRRDVVDGTLGHVGRVTRGLVVPAAGDDVYAGYFGDPLQPGGVTPEPP